MKPTGLEQRERAAGPHKAVSKQPLSAEKSGLYSPAPYSQVLPGIMGCMFGQGRSAQDDRGRKGQVRGLPPCHAHHLRWPIWASGTRSRMIRQASYTIVDGSNCIVFTALPMLTLSDNATMAAVESCPLLLHLLKETPR